MTLGLLAMLLLGGDACAPDGAPGRLDARPIAEGAMLALRSEHAAAFVASTGVVEDIASDDACLRARWRLQRATRPGWAVAAAFEGEQLVDWRAFPRIASRIQEVEAPPGAPVRVEIDGRVFEGISSGDRIARVEVAIPPGVEHAMVEVRGRRFSHPLAPPPLLLEHTLLAPDGARWVFHIDASGRPWDAPVAPACTVRIAPGAYRFASSTASLPAAEPPLVVRPSRAADVWRVGAGAHVGPTTRRGFGAHVGREGSLRRFIGWGGAAALLFSGRRFREIGGDGVIQTDVLAAAGWGELVLGGKIAGPLRMALAPGAGVTLAHRRSALNGGAPGRSTRAGPLLSGALRVGLGPLDLEARALASSVPLRPDDSRLGWLFGISWAFGRSM